jgi:hypothetical protein
MLYARGMYAYIYNLYIMSIVEYVHTWIQRSYPKIQRSQSYESPSSSCKKIQADRPWTSVNPLYFILLLIENSTMKLFVRLFVASLMALQVTAADNAQYNNGENNYYDNADYDADYAYSNNGFLDFTTCSDGVVQVTNVKILCDSPYEWSSGNGAHRNIPLCDYGDTATITVYFSVSKTLGYSDNIFIDMGVYALKDDLELLWEQNAVELSTLVGHSCTTQGTYAFATSGSFASFDTDMSEFYPYVEIAFSTAADQGTNLGGVNVQCQLDNFFNAWAGTKSSHGTRAGKFLLNLFISAAVLGFIGAGAYVVHQKYRDNIEYQGTIDKINGYYNNMGWGETEGVAEEIGASKSEDESMHA